MTVLPECRLSELSQDELVVLRHAIEDAEGAGASRREFLNASIAVWREIDRLGAGTGGYKGLAPSTDLRRRERAAWDRYRATLDAALAAHGSVSLPNEENREGAFVVAMAGHAGPGTARDKWIWDRAWDEASARVASLEAALREIYEQAHANGSAWIRNRSRAALVAAPSRPEGDSVHPSEWPAATEDPADDPLIEEPMDYSPIGAREPSDEEAVERVAKALYDSNGKQHGGYEDVPRRKGITRYRTFEWEELAEEDKAGTRKHAAAAIAAFREPVARGETE